jgi:hypothetical protein
VVNETQSKVRARRVERRWSGPSRKLHQCRCVSTYRFLNLVFRYPQDYQAAVEYLQNGTETKRLDQELIDNLEVRGNDLVYKPDELITVPPDQVSDVLKREYGDLSKSAGVGTQKLYEVVRGGYAGVSRAAVSRFLQAQPNYQLSKDFRSKKLANKPILAKRPLEKVFTDLVEVRKPDRGRKYFTTLCDYFSRYVWLRPLKGVTATEVRGKLDGVFTREEGGKYPSVLVSDQGSSFKGEALQWVKARGVRSANTRSYSPLGLEKVNGLTRGKLRGATVRSQSTEWVRHLPTVADQRNQTPHGPLKHSPNFLYLSAPEGAHEEQEAARKALEDKATRGVKRTQRYVKELQVGGVVSVSLRAVDTFVRKELKDFKSSKNTVVRYTPELYRVRSTTKPDLAERGALPWRKKRVLRYTLKGTQGRVLTTQRLRSGARDRERRAGRFFASELTLVAKKGQPTPEGADTDPGLTTKLNVGTEIGERGHPAPKKPRAPRKKAAQREVERRSDRARKPPRRDEAEGCEYPQQPQPRSA